MLSRSLILNHVILSSNLPFFFLRESVSIILILCATFNYLIAHVVTQLMCTPFLCCYYIIKPIFSINKDKYVAILKHWIDIIF